jgi:hypothetical protein
MTTARLIACAAMMTVSVSRDAMKMRAWNAYLSVPLGFTNASTSARPNIAKLAKSTGSPAAEFVLAALVVITAPLLVRLARFIAQPVASDVNCAIR